VTLLKDKKILITGVLTEQSLAYAVAEQAIEAGAQIVLTGAGRGLSLTQRAAKKLSATTATGEAIDVLELDVTQPEHFDNLHSALNERWGRLDGVLHAIGFAPASCLGGDFLEAPWEDVATAIHISTYSLAPLVKATLPLMQTAGGGSVVGLDFDARVSWPAYDWMGVAKAGLESATRYLARVGGPHNVRVNLIAAGPIRSMAAKSIPGFAKFEEVWGERAPLGWSVNDATPVAKTCCALLSDWMPSTTGELIHVDGGYHAMGA